nr:MAG TPA: hypothetical protein [Caudoviricetes sp.]
MPSIVPPSNLLQVITVACKSSISKMYAHYNMLYLNI